MVAGLSLRIFVALSVASMVGAIRSSQEQSLVEDESQSDCSSIVPGSVARKYAGKRRVRCQCQKDEALKGPVEFCGRSGRITLFDPLSLPPRNCSCARLRTCPRMGTTPDFNVTHFARQCWFVQQQGSPTKDPTRHGTHCVNTIWTLKQRRTGYPQITIRTSGRHPFGGNGLGGHEFSQRCAAVADKWDPSVMGIRKCFAASRFSAPLWVITYNETAGYAILGRGQPRTRTVYGCRHKMKKTEGVQILTRLTTPPAGVMERALAELTSRGYDTSRLQEVTFDNQCFGTCFDEEKTIVQNERDSETGFKLP